MSKDYNALLDSHEEECTLNCGCKIKRSPIARDIVQLYFCPMHDGAEITLARNNVIMTEAADKIQELSDSCARHDDWVRQAKREAGFKDHTSFDVVWAHMLRFHAALKFIEDNHTLHNELDITHTVDGYTVQRSEDGFYKGVKFSGNTLLEAIEAMMQSM